MQSLRPLPARPPSTKPTRNYAACRGGCVRDANPVRWPLAHARRARRDLPGPRNCRSSARAATDPPPSPPVLHTATGPRAPHPDVLPGTPPSLYPSPRPASPPHPPHTSPRPAATLHSAHGGPTISTRPFPSPKATQHPVPPALLRSTGPTAAAAAPLPQPHSLQPPCCCCLLPRSGTELISRSTLGAALLYVDDL